MSSLDQSKRARVMEHRLSEHTIGLVCRLPRAQGLTRLIHPILVCAFGEQRRSTALTPLPPTPGGVRSRTGWSTTGPAHLTFRFRRRTVDRERDMERRPLPFLAFHLDRPSMGIHNIFHNL